MSGGVCLDATARRRSILFLLAVHKAGDLITHLGTKQLYTATDIAAVGKPTPRNPILVRIVHDQGARSVLIADTLLIDAMRCRLDFLL